MLEFFHPVRGTDLKSLVLKILLTSACGALIGLERSAKNRPAGFRTHILVCLGSATAALAGLYIYLDLGMVSDISRISAQVISGLGFILAGTIVVTKKMTIKGLTTAAGLWTTGIIGIAIGSGYYEAGILGTALVLLAEGWLSKFSGAIHPQPEYTLLILYREKTSLDQVLRSCKDHHLSIVNLKIRTMAQSTLAEYAADVHLRGGMAAEEMVDRIRLMPGIASVEEV